MTINWAMIGCGAVTELKSGPAYQQTKGFKLVGVWSRTIEKTKAYAIRHNINKVYVSADELINDPNIDAVYIATPPDSHLHYALQVAKANKICCIEKPIAPNLNDSIAIVDSFADKNLPLYIAYYRRSLPRFNKIKDLIESKRIGDIRSVSWRMTRSPSPVDLSNDYNWRTDKSIAPGGYFDDIGCHGLDLFAFLFGGYRHVSGVCCNKGNLYSAADSIAAHWVHDSGVMGTGDWQFVADTREDIVTIVGSLGKISFSVLLEEPIRIYKNGQLVDEIVIPHPKHIQQYHVVNMANSLKNNVAHPSTGKTALEAAKAMSAILADFNE